MTSFTQTIRHLVGALYAWSVAVFLGAVLLDIVYANLLDGASTSVAQSVFGEVSDLLLIVGGFSLLAALGAIAVSWGVPSAMYLFTASMVVLLSEFLGPIVLFPLLRGLPNSSLVVAIGPLLRLLPIALASLLAFGALRVLLQDTRTPSPS